MNVRRILAIGALFVIAMSLVAYTTQKSAGTKKVFLHIGATGVYAFPRTGTANLTSPFTANTTWSPNFVTIARSAGANTGTFVVYSSCFQGGSDTVFAGPVIPEITDRVDSIECVVLGTGCEWQVEGSN